MEQEFISTRSLTPTLQVIGRQRQVPNILPSVERLGSHFQKVGWTPVSILTNAINLASTGIRSHNRGARSQSLYRLCSPDNVKTQSIVYSGNVTKGSHFCCVTPCGCTDSTNAHSNWLHLSSGQKIEMTGSM